MNKIELSIVALTNSLATPTNYAIILQEESGKRRLPIIIGSFEAQSIAMALERMETSRPLTHDLFHNAMNELKVKLKEVIISRLMDGVFHADMVCQRNDGEEMAIDARTSDAIALAVRFECPIYTYENIMDAASISAEDEEADAQGKPSKKVSRKTKKRMGDYTLQELEIWLDEVLSEENYEQAAKIRDEINKRVS